MSYNNNNELRELIEECKKEIFNVGDDILDIQVSINSIALSTTNKDLTDIVIELRDLFDKLTDVDYIEVDLMVLPTKETIRKFCNKLDLNGATQTLDALNVFCGVCIRELNNVVTKDEFAELVIKSMKKFNHLCIDLA